MDMATEVAMPGLAVGLTVEAATVGVGRVKVEKGEGAKAMGTKAVVVVGEAFHQAQSVEMTAVAAREAEVPMAGVSAAVEAEEAKECGMNHRPGWHHCQS